jgi:adenylosuccinate lyase
MSKRFTASRVPDSGIEALFGTEERWQAWLAIESALALTQADLDDLSGGMIRGEAIMLELGKTIGRQHAHDVVYQAAQAAASQNSSFPDRLAADHRITALLSRSAIDALLDPASHSGFSAKDCARAG